jgi:hypothetical protein
LVWHHAVSYRDVIHRARNGPGIILAIGDQKPTPCAPRIFAHRWDPMAQRELTDARPVLVGVQHQNVPRRLGQGLCRNRLMTSTTPFAMALKEETRTILLTMQALHQVTRAIPIVFAQVIDPIGGGFAASLARPGGTMASEARKLSRKVNRVVRYEQGGRFLAPGSREKPRKLICKRRSSSWSARQPFGADSDRAVSRRILQASPQAPRPALRALPKRCG